MHLYYEGVVVNGFVSSSFKLDKLLTFLALRMVFKIAADAHVCVCKWKHVSAITNYAP